MSTATITTSPPPTTPMTPGEPQGRVTLSRVIGSEWMKFRTLRSTWYSLGTAMIALPVFGVIIAYLTRSSVNLQSEDTAPSAVLQGFIFAQLVVAVLGVLFVSGEYGTGMIRSTLAAVPRRIPVLLAKAGVLTAVLLVPLALTSLGTFLGAEAILASSGHGYALSDPTALRVVLGTGVFLTLIGLLGSAFGWILRSTAAGISAILGLLLVVPVLFQSLLGSWGKNIAQFLPSVAGESFVSSLRAVNTLAPWPGLAVMGAWVVLALAIAAVQLRRRDA